MITPKNAPNYWPPLACLMIISPTLKIYSHGGP